MLDHAQILALLPHRHPMLLVDAVTRLEPWVSLVAIKNVTANEPCYARVGEAAARSRYAYPCSLILESFAQTAAILLSGWWRDNGAPPDALLLFYSLAGACFTGAEVYPGDTLEHHARVERHLADVAILGGEVRVRDRRVAAIERIVVKRAPRLARHEPRVTAGLRADEGG